MTEAPKPTEINISLASQLPEAATSPRLLVLTTGFYVDQGRAAGYGGMEWHPLRNTTAAGVQTNYFLNFNFLNK